MGEKVTADAACKEDHVFTRALSEELRTCESKCNSCPTCVGFVHHKDDNKNHCSFHSSDDVDILEKNDWYGKFGPPKEPALTPSDGKSDQDLGMNAPSVTEEEKAASCSSCKAIFYEHYAPGHGDTGATLGTITTISTNENPQWTDIQPGTSSIVIEGDDNCAVVTNADPDYEYIKRGGRSGGTNKDGWFNHPLPTGNDNIVRATLLCASDKSKDDESLEGSAASSGTCTDCQVVFYEHYAPGFGDTGAILGVITMAEITTDLHSPKWVQLTNDQTSSAVLTGDARCRFRTDADTNNRVYARSASSGGGPSGVFNFEMPSGNDVVTKAYMWCAGVQDSRDDEA